MAIVVFAFVIYLVPGMFGAPLKLIGAFPPPDFYTEGWKLGSEKGSETGSLDNTQRAEELAAGIDREHCPLGLPCFHDYETGLAYAKKVNKPVMIDFTGWACVNCRKMENNVWSDPEVYRRLENDYVLISLYVDDKAKLPEGEIYYSEVLKKKVNTVGRKWTEMEVSRYNRNSQPYYVLLDHNEKELTEGKAYDPSIENFIAFLDAGTEAFAQKQ
jgi:thiol:disulfide interchange protein DsbD